MPPVFQKTQRKKFNSFFAFSFALMATLRPIFCLDETTKHMDLPLAKSPLSLIVTADDFGFGVPTSRGIIRAHQAGVVTSTSLMVVTGDHAGASILLLKDAPNLEVGLHLVLTGPAQKPLVAGKTSGLVTRHGTFNPLGKLLWIAWRRKLDRNAVIDEICAQAQRFTALLGRPPAYVDGHHHSHQLPVIREALVDAMKLGVLPKITRCTIEPPSIRSTVGGSRLRRAVMHHLGSTAQSTFADAGIWTNDSCFGMIGARELKQPQPWADYFNHLPGHGAIEWFVHPGEQDDSLVGRDTYIGERQVELDALVRLGDSPEWVPWAKRRTTKSAYCGGTGFQPVSANTPLNDCA